MTRDEIDKMKYAERTHAINYCWMKFNTRRPDMALKQMFGKKEKKKKTEGEYIDTLRRGEKPDEV